MDLYSSLQDKRFDVRLIERNIREQSLTTQELEKKLKELPDLSAQCESLKMDNSSNMDRFNL